MRSPRMLHHAVGPGVDQPPPAPRMAVTARLGAVGLAAATTTFRAGRRIRVAVVVFATGPLIGTAYLVGAHLADPCDRGWWDFDSELVGARLCSRRGEITQRFHLLLHGTTGVLAAAVAATLFRPTRLIGWTSRQQQIPETR